MSSAIRWTAAGAAVLFLTAASWLPLVSPDPLVYPGLPNPVVRTLVRQGDPLVIVTNRCNNDGAPLAFTSTRYLERSSDHVRIPLSDGSGVAQPGCASEEIRLAIITEDIDPGYYTLHGVTRVIGRLKSSSVPWHTQEFQVVEP